MWDSNPRFRGCETDTLTIRPPLLLRHITQVFLYLSCTWWHDAGNQTFTKKSRYLNLLHKYARFLKHHKLKKNYRQERVYSLTASLLVYDISNSIFLYRQTDWCNSYKKCKKVFYYKNCKICAINVIYFCNTKLIFIKIGKLIFIKIGI